LEGSTRGWPALNKTRQTTRARPRIPQEPSDRAPMARCLDDRRRGKWAPTVPRRRAGPVRAPVACPCGGAPMIATCVLPAKPRRARDGLRCVRVRPSVSRSPAANATGMGTGTGPGPSPCRSVRRRAGARACRVRGPERMRAGQIVRDIFPAGHSYLLPDLGRMGAGDLACHAVTTHKVTRRSGAGDGWRKQ
jgi:hypothetical protein